MENLEKREKLIAALYSDREKYTIVALTGYTGTGCSSLANLMSTPFKQWNDLRLPNDLTIPKPQTVDNEELMQKGLNNHKSIGNTIFARKYTLCYNFASNHYEKFKILKYSHALIFYTLNYIINTALAGETVAEDKKLKLHSNLESILKDKFRPSRDRKDDNYRQKRICQDYP